MNDIPRDAERKPDPDEPFRYVCPQCDKQVNGSKSTIDTYHCNHCPAAYDFDELYDLKLKTIVSNRQPVASD